MILPTTKNGWIWLLFVSALEQFFETVKATSRKIALSNFRTVHWIVKCFFMKIMLLSQLRPFRCRIQFTKYAYCVVVCMYGAQVCHAATISPTASPTIKGSTICNDGICYWVSESTSTTSWSACNATCSSHKVEMLCIQSRAQNTYVSSIINGYTYLGITATKTVDSYSWQNGCVSSYTNWNQISNQIPYAGIISTYSSGGGN